MAAGLRGADLPTSQSHGLENPLVAEFRLVISLLRLGGFLLAGGLLFVLAHHILLFFRELPGPLTETLCWFAGQCTTTTRTLDMLRRGRGNIANTCNQFSSKKGCHSGGRIEQPSRTAAHSKAAGVP